MPPTSEPHPEDLLTSTEVCRLLKISRSTFNRYREHGIIPQPVISASRSTMRWRRGDVLSAGMPRPQRGTIAERLHVACTHIRAAAMGLRTSAIHADAAQAIIRQLFEASIPSSALTNQPTQGESHGSAAKTEAQ